MDRQQSIREFVDYAEKLEGREKSEAQVFCDRLFKAFGHDGYAEAGATLEDPIKRSGRSTGFADLLWKPRLLLEMKSSNQKIQRHYQQAFDYWLHATPHRPRYVVICNFLEFWVYDFDIQLHEPVDKITLSELPDRFAALNFLFPEDPPPLFGNNRVAVTREAASKVAKVFNALIERGEDRQRTQVFILQCVVAMFSEDFDLLPRGLFTSLLAECMEINANSYDLIGALFTQMNSADKATGGRFIDVDYFNGGLFDQVGTIELNNAEISLLMDAAQENWRKVAPPIFGTLFQESMDKDYRHALGAHFTTESDIQKIIQPTIVKPWRERIENASKLKDLMALNNELLNIRVLDPACGSGNFLYVAYREIVNLNMEILTKIRDNFSRRSISKAGSGFLADASLFYGIDRDPFAVELAKVTLMLSKRLAVSEVEELWLEEEQSLSFDFDKPLPLDNLDDSITCGDALFEEWPSVDYIVGNPPFQSKNKMTEEFGASYVREVRGAYSEVSGRADYCVYWFRKTHDQLPDNGQAGLVGTNTIRQTYSREGGLDYIVENGGTIIDAVSSQVWSGDAVVNVSIVNWKKGGYDGEKKLVFQHGDNIDSPWSSHTVGHINTSLSLGFDVSQAASLMVNSESNTCYQGQTHGQAGFLLSDKQKAELLKDKTSGKVVHPYLIGDDVLGRIDGSPSRSIIDLNHCADVPAAKVYRLAFAHLQKNVLPSVQKNAEKERKANPKKKTGPRRSHARKWWKYWRSRDEMISEIMKNSRYIVCSRVTRRPIFQFVSKLVRPNDALQVFALDDDYSFGILQSSVHAEWFDSRCSTLKRDPRYTSNTVYDSFVWPQSPSTSQAVAVAKAALDYRKVRQSLVKSSSSCLREIYKDLETPGHNRLRDSQEKLDKAVRAAYSMKNNDDTLEFLFNLNCVAVKKEVAKQFVQGPGIPKKVAKSKLKISRDCVKS